jgi:ribonuclease Y
MIFTKEYTKKNCRIYEKESKAKAKAIQKEAELVLKEARIQEKELRFKLKKEFEEKNRDVELKLQEKRNLLKKEQKDLDKSKRDFEKEKSALKRSKEHYNKKLNSVVRILENAAGLTKTEAKEVLLKKIEEESRAEISHIVRKHEIEAREKAEKKANYILAQATSRFAGEFAAERLQNVIKLQSDDIKGRIIGKEGRNIKRLESILGVDIIVDGTPRTISLSSFNLYRRAIAVKTIEELIQDGRIQPARIEEIFDKVKKDFEKDIYKEGENVLMDLGITNMHPELIRLLGKLKFRASYGQNALAHSIEVAYLSGIMTAEMGGDELLARRAGLLHDIGKSLTHESGGNHVDLGVSICKKYNEDEVVINAIYAHHDYEEPKSIESATVCAADKLSAARPGARREVLESSLKRVKQIEEVALSYDGVEDAYAVNSGRELRVIVNSKAINDDETVLISKKIGNEIKQKVEKFPGEIVVSVIREIRSKTVIRNSI